MSPRGELVEKIVNGTKIILKVGDIVAEEVDVIVNAANSKLTGGGGVDGAIRRAGGPKIAEECGRITKIAGRCRPGHAVITSGGDLFAKHIVHAVGPVWHGGKDGEDEVLGLAYLHCLAIAYKVRAKTVSFPSISTGAFGYPIELAAEVAFKTMKRFLSENPDLFHEIRFVLFSQQDYEVYREACERILV